MLAGSAFRSAAHYLLQFWMCFGECKMFFRRHGDHGSDIESIRRSMRRRNSERVECSILLCTIAEYMLRGMLYVSS